MVAFLTSIEGEKKYKLFMSTKGRTRYNVLKIEKWRLTFCVDSNDFPTN